MILIHDEFMRKNNFKNLLGVNFATMDGNMQKQPDRKFQIKEPFTIVVHFLLAGIVVLFLGLTYGYLFQLGHDWLVFSLPKVFWLSTVAIIAVSFFLHRSLSAFDQDNRFRLRLYLSLSCCFGLLFIYFQLIGWRLLINANILLETSPSSSYLYLLTGLHGIHVIAGILFLFVAIFRVFANTSDEVKSLIYFSDFARRTRLKLLRNYWHTIDGLWIFLFLVFLFRHA